MVACPMRHQREHAIQRLPVLRARAGLCIVLERCTRALIQVVRMIMEKTVGAADAGAEIDPDPRRVHSGQAEYTRTCRIRDDVEARTFDGLACGTDGEHAAR